MLPNSRRQSSKMPVVAIVHSDIGPDAPLDEQDTLVTANFIQKLLAEKGYRSFCLPYRPDEMTQHLNRLQCDLIFNLVESIKGKGSEAWRAIEWFEAFGMPFTGSRSFAYSMTTDKIATKRALREAGLPTPKWLDEEEIQSGAEIARPYILKPRSEDASVGIFADSITDNPDMLRALLLDRKARYGGDWFAEEFIEGREFHVGVLETPEGIRVLPPSELDFSLYAPDMPRISSYSAKWQVHSPEYTLLERTFIYKDMVAEHIKELQTIALRCWKIFRLNGWARIDFRVRQGGRPYILDINANPSLDDDAGFIAAVRQAGLQPADAPDYICRAALAHEDVHDPAFA